MSNNKVSTLSVSDRIVFTGGSSISADSNNILCFGGTGFVFSGLARSLSGGFGFPDGTILTSATGNYIPVNFWGSGNSGIYSLANKNVGIGTDAPSQKLSVNGYILSQSGGFIFPDDSILTGAPIWITAGLNTYVNTAGGVGVGTNEITDKLTVNGTVYAKVNGFKFPDGTLQTTASENPWTINGLNIYYDTAGGVGIGTSGITDKLTVNGTIYSKVNGFKFPDGTMQDTAATPNPWTITGINIFFDTAGGVSIGTSNITDKLAVNGTIHSLANGFKFPDGTMQSTAAVAGQWSDNGSSIYYNGGNVGVGASSPSELFEVNGNPARISIKNENGAAELRFKTDPSDGAGYTAYIRKGTDGNFRLGTNTGNLMLLTHADSYIEYVANSNAMGFMSQYGWEFGGSYFPGFSSIVTINGSSAGSSSYGLTVTDSTGGYNFRVRDDGGININKINNFTAAAAANLYTDGTLMAKATSSRKYKHSISGYTRGIEDVMKLNPVFYCGKSIIDSGKTFAGFIAEEIHDLGYTEFVDYNSDKEPDGLHYAQMTALLAKGLQDAYQEIKAMKQQIIELNNRIQILEQ